VRQPGKPLVHAGGVGGRRGDEDELGHAEGGVSWTVVGRGRLRERRDDDLESSVIFAAASSSTGTARRIGFGKLWTRG
jgi:hypothetical protein